MKLLLTQRQLLSRCSLRHYSASAVSGSAVAVEETPRIRRPLASSFGGINIQNVEIPARSEGSRNKTSPGDSPKHGSSVHRENQKQPYRPAGKPRRPAMSGWGDGLVTLSFSSRLDMREKNMSSPNTTPHPEAQTRQQQPKPKQRPQMQGRQQESGAKSHTPRHAGPRKFDRATQTSRQPAVDAEPRVASMTKPSASRHNIHARSKPPASTAARKSKHVAEEVPATNNVALADRVARLAALSSTNLNALFRTRDTPVAGTPLPAHASSTARVRSVLERSAGDYSRFLPRRVGVRKSMSHPPALRTARHALAAQRDVSLAQRRVALHIIGGLAESRRQMNA